MALGGDRAAAIQKLALSTQEMVPDTVHFSIPGGLLLVPDQVSTMAK